MSIINIVTRPNVVILEDIMVFEKAVSSYLFFNFMQMWMGELQQETQNILWDDGENQSTGLWGFHVRFLSRFKE